MESSQSLVRALIIWLARVVISAAAFVSTSSTAPRLCPILSGWANMVAPLFYHMGGLKRLSTFTAAEPSHVPFEGAGLRQTKHGR